MEFHEKLYSLRKSRGLTQEELGEALFVSRAAVSKWEQGRGYPTVDSLRDISDYFSVSIDDLLSGEKLLFIAEKESKSKIRSLTELLFGITDLMSFLLIVLPLYPHREGDFVYSVNLVGYLQIAPHFRAVYIVLFSLLVLLGVIKLLLVRTNKEKPQKMLSEISVIISILTVIFLSLTKETYALIMAFLLLIIKAVLIIKSGK